MKVIGALMLLGTPSNLLCFIWHTCMAGHMRHGPYPVYHWANDFFWISCFSCVLVLSIYLKTKFQKWFFYGSAILLLSRIGLGSFGGGSILLEFPLLIVLDVFALKYIRSPTIYLIIDKPIE